MRRLAKLRWRRSTNFDHLWFFCYPHGFCGVLPVLEGYHRLFFLSTDTGLPDRDPTLEEMQTIAREVTQDETLTLTDPIWLTHSRFQHGVSSDYAKGRVLLVVDAGHLTLPAGGQGMNAGLHDAIGLAWRLAMVLDGKATAVVLDSYDAERGGEHLGLIQAGLPSLKAYLASGELIEILPDLRPAPLPVSVVVAHRQNLSRRVQTFIEWLEQALQADLEQELAKSGRVPKAISSQ